MDDPHLCIGRILVRSYSRSFETSSPINTNIDNVTASGFNTVVAKTVGTGIVRENQVAIQIGAIGASGDAWYQPAKQVTLERSDSMAEMVANINAAFYENSNRFIHSITNHFSNSSSRAFI